MYPEDRVLVGAITRKSDLQILLNQGWYRIPHGRAPNGIDANYLAFFTNAKVSDAESGIYYFAEQRGVELMKRKDLLPGKKPNKKDDNLYHKIQLGEIQRKEPPILNEPNPYRFAFIYTTGDRFQQAQHIRDLFSKADYFVDRVFHVLKDKGLQPQRTWEKVISLAEKREHEDVIYPTYAQVRLIADRGEVIGTTNPNQRPSSEREEILYFQPSNSEAEASANAEAMVEAVQRFGGAKLLKLPIELS